MASKETAPREALRPQGLRVLPLRSSVANLSVGLECDRTGTKMAGADGSEMRPSRNASASTDCPWQRGLRDSA